ncbi:ATP-binding protein [Candidatus Dependentiae bacterium]|nr:ATP-binding protein [Candidatus Dependentiae bacterium]
MYCNLYKFLFVIGCFSGHLFSHEDGNTDLRKDTISIYQNLHDGSIIGKRSRKSKNLEFIQYRVDESVQKSGSSGYHALKNGLLTTRLLQASAENQPAIASEFKDSLLSNSLFGTENSVWRNDIIKSRRKNLAAQYIQDIIILGLNECIKVQNNEENSLNSYVKLPLSIDKVSAAIDRKKISDEKFRDIKIICFLSKFVAQELVERQSAQRTENVPGNEFSYRVSHDDIFTVFAEICEQKRVSVLPQEKLLRELIIHSSLNTKESFVNCFLPFQESYFTVISGLNQNEIIIDGSSYYKKLYGPTDREQVCNGDWLSLPEVIEIAQKEREDSSCHFHKELSSHLEMHTFDFSTGMSYLDELKTEMRCKTVFEKIEKSTSPAAAILLILSNHHWFSCVVAKTVEGLCFIVTDSTNADRSNDPVIAKLGTMIDENESKTSSATGDFRDSIKNLLEKKSSENNSEEDVVNYDAPHAHMSLEELPSLDLLFGGKLTNDIHMILHHLKTEVAPTKKPLKFKNGLILSGPPGTGKSTVAQVMARMAGREVLYAGGGDFRTAYQGSSKAKLDALFGEAKKRGKPCVIIIDEIDGTTAKLQPQGSTAEDNRAIKALITTLDQHRNDPSIYVIATTNYPEKIDPAILRRFNRIEVGLPNYEARNNILKDHLFEKNELEIKNGDPLAVSPSFYDLFLTATDGFSGDALEDIVNTATEQARAGLTAESQIGARFSNNLIDFSNHSVVSSIANTAALPFFHVLQGVGLNAPSTIDQHLYSQLLRHKKLKADIEERDFNETHRNHRLSDLFQPQYLGYMVASGLITGALNAFIQVASNRVLGRSIGTGTIPTTIVS